MKATSEPSVTGSRLERLLQRWADVVRRRALPVSLAAVPATVLLVWYAGANLRVDTDTSDMFPADLPWRQTRIAYNAAFPALDDNILVELRGLTPDQTERAQQALADAMRADTLFRSVYLPGSGPYFQENGLLLRELGDLRELEDRLAEVAPLLRRLEGRPDLPGTLAVMDSLLRTPAAERSVDPGPVLGLFSQGVSAMASGGLYQVPWQAVLQGRSPTAADRRRFLVVSPVLDFGRLRPARAPLERIRELASSLGLTPWHGVSLRVTGEMAMRHEELESVLLGSKVAGVLSLIMVAGILYLGLRSLALGAAALATLVTGLAGTAAFAVSVVGRLNLISVAFAVLYVGLAVDYAIHLCLRFRELREEGSAPPGALRRAVGDVGPSLLLSAVTTAASFFVFIPTDFAGVSQLGLIAGGGMFIGLAVTLTLLPALLALGGLDPGPGEAVTGTGPLARLGAVTLRHRRSIMVGAGVMAVASTVFLTRARFDHNPLSMRDPDSEAALVYRELLADTTTSPLTLAVREPTLAEAMSTAERLKQLPEVDAARTLESYVPKNQQPKLAVLARIDSLLGPAPPTSAVPAPAALHPARMTEPDASVERTLRALEDFQHALSWYASVGSDPEARRARYLALQITGWRERLELWPREQWSRLVSRLEWSLVGALPGRLRSLRRALAREPVTRDDLPGDLVERWVGTDGSYRVEVQPKGDVSRTPALRRFVLAVGSAVDQVTGAAVTQLEAGNVAVRAFRTSLLLAVAAVATILLLSLRSVGSTALVLSPLLLAGAVTGASTVALDLPFNFANIVTLPLILGVGVDTGIHLVHRWRTARPPDGNLLATSTARAAVFAFFTTVASFGTLALSPHPGTASMGKLLTVGMLATLAATLVVIPVLLDWPGFPRAGSAGGVGGGRGGDARVR